MPLKLGLGFRKEGFSDWARGLEIRGWGFRALQTKCMSDVNPCHLGASAITYIYIFFWGGFLTIVVL